MELFKTDILKKEYKIFVEQTILKITDCNYCNQTCCAMHYCFDVCCKKCRIAKCYNCQVFNQQLDALMKAASNETREYIYTFVRDFFAISSQSLKFFYNTNKKLEINEEDLSDFTWKLRLYHGTKYSMVEHLSKTMRFTYTIRKIRFVYNLK